MHPMYSNLSKSGMLSSRAIRLQNEQVALFDGVKQKKLDVQNEHLHKNGGGEGPTGAARAIIGVVNWGGDWPWISLRKSCGSDAQASAL